MNHSASIKTPAEAAKVASATINNQSLRPPPLAAPEPFVVEALVCSHIVSHISPTPPSCPHLLTVEDIVRLATALPPVVALVPSPTLLPTLALAITAPIFVAPAVTCTTLHSACVGALIALVTPDPVTLPSMLALTLPVHLTDVGLGTSQLSLMMPNPPLLEVE